MNCVLCNNFISQDNLELELHLREKTLTPKLCRYPSNTRSRFRRRFNIHHLPKLSHHRRPRHPRRSHRRRTSRNPSLRPKRRPGPVNSTNRRVPLLLHHRRDLGRAPGLELRLQLHEQRHVRGAVRLHAGNLPDQGPRDRQRRHGDGQPHLRHHGAHHRHLCQSRDQCARLRFGGLVHRGGIADGLTSF